MTVRVLPDTAVPSGNGLGVQAAALSSVQAAVPGQRAQGVKCDDAARAAEEAVRVQPAIEQPSLQAMGASGTTASASSCVPAG